MDSMRSRCRNRGVVHANEHPAACEMAWPNADPASHSGTPAHIMAKNACSAGSRPCAMSTRMIGDMQMVTVSVPSAIAFGRARSGSSARPNISGLSH